MIFPRGLFMMSVILTNEFVSFITRSVG